MKFVFFLVAFKILFEISKCSTSQLKNLDSPQNLNTIYSEVYTFIPMFPYNISENSIQIYDENALILDQLHVKDLKEHIGISWDSAHIFSIKHIKDNIFIVPIINDDTGDLDDMDSVHYIFIDDYFKIKYKLFNSSFILKLIII